MRNIHGVWGTPPHHKQSIAYSAYDYVRMLVPADFPDMPLPILICAYPVSANGAHCAYTFGSVVELRECCRRVSTYVFGRVPSLGESCSLVHTDF